MSWLDKIQTQLTITTGDKQSYTPEWMNAKKKVDFNIAKFEFPHVPGSLVDRKEPKGTEYNIEIHFQGNGLYGNQNANGQTLDHLDAASQFQTSANDKRAWTIKHPFYGQIKVQPISLDFDNSTLNITRITGVVIETISQDYPVGSVNPANKINSDSISTAQTFSIAGSDSATGVITSIANKTKSVQKLQGQLSTFKDAVTKALSGIQNHDRQIQDGQADYNDYLNLFNQAYSSVSNVFASVIINSQNAINLTQATIMAPALFALSIKNRVLLLGSQFTYLSQVVADDAITDKILYSTNGGVCIAAICLACSNPQPNDFIYASDTLDTIAQLLAFYNEYLINLDLLQTTNGGSVNSFIPDHDSLIALDELVNFTSRNLFNIAFNGKQQRSILTEADTNWILLTHRLYGLDTVDANIDTLMQQNGAGLSTILQVKKNTKIIYYI